MAVESMLFWCTFHPIIKIHMLIRLIKNFPPGSDWESSVLSTLCSAQVGNFINRAVARTLIGKGGGGVPFIYSYFARQISFQIDEYEFDLKRNLSGMNMHPPPPQLTF